MRVEASARHQNHSVNRYRAAALAAVVALALAAALVLWPHPPAVLVKNVDGQSVEVTVWDGGPSSTVPCGAARSIDTSGAHGQPLVVTVTSIASHRVLLHQSIAESVEVIVRQGGVLMGAPNPPSVGPAGAGC
jgi:hypothetical protein